MGKFILRVRSLILDTTSLSFFATFANINSIVYTYLFIGKQPFCLEKIPVHWKSGYPTIQGMSIFCSICISIYKCVTEMKTTSDLLHISCLLNVKNFLLVFLQNQNLKKATHLCRKWGGREENKAICHKSATDGQTNWQSGLCSRMHELKMQEQSLSCTHQQDSDISTTRAVQNEMTTWRHFVF